MRYSLFTVLRTGCCRTFYLILIFSYKSSSTVFLWPDGLRCTQTRQLLWGLWVDNGGVSPLEVLGDALYMTVSLVQLPLGEEVLKL